ncbi:nucleoporin complex subunit 54-domain-containing protein [Rhodotorula diobovata]|uniref:Nucleoporin complex subunit 54-domain-containing protein n=1 Tax=Rhodotorula diobovata TaxID=5288 RepID=A0A5C5G510_9BASI|nr:nucleoporin complex subunit 54-domain-containing protein [Rhodotorula diobovata]
MCAGCNQCRGRDGASPLPRPAHRVHPPSLDTARGWIQRAVHCSARIEHPRLPSQQRAGLRRRPLALLGHLPPSLLLASTDPPCPAHSDCAHVQPCHSPLVHPPPPSPRPPDSASAPHPPLPPPPRPRSLAAPRPQRPSPLRPRPSSVPRLSRVRPRHSSARHPPPRRPRPRPSLASPPPRPSQVRPPPFLAARPQNPQGRASLAPPHRRQRPRRAEDSLARRHAAPASGGLFGQQQPQQQQQQQQQQQPSTSLFGQSQTAATASLFGSKPASGGLFGASTATAPSQSGQQYAPATIPKLGDPLPPSPSEPSIESRLEALKAAWDPQSPKCRFQAYFYNELPAGHSREMYARPAPGTDEARWERARRENPEPERLVPALAVGFPALDKRIAAQSLRASQHAALLAELHTHLGSLSSTHTLTTSLRTQRAQQNAVALHARLTALVARAAALSPARAAGLRADEDALRVELERQRGEVERVRAKVGELWAGVGAVKKRRDGEAGDQGRVEWAVSDEEGLRRVLEILSSQQAGLDHVSRTVKGMASDVDVMREAFGLPLTRVVGAAAAGSVGGSASRDGQ